MDAKTAKSKAAHLCAVKECPESDIRTGLKRWGISETESEHIISWLKTNGFIDENRYAAAYVREKLRIYGWGKIKIGAALRVKGINEAVINTAMASIEENEWVEACKKILRKKQNLIKEKDPHKCKATLIRFALGRGFEYDIICRCLPFPATPSTPL